MDCEMNLGPFVSRRNLIEYYACRRLVMCWNGVNEGLTDVCDEEWVWINIESRDVNQRQHLAVQFQFKNCFTLAGRMIVQDMEKGGGVGVEEEVRSRVKGVLNWRCGKLKLSLFSSLYLTFTVIAKSPLKEEAGYIFRTVVVRDVSAISLLFIITGVGVDIKKRRSTKKIRNYPDDYVVRVCTIEHTLHLPELLLLVHSQRPTLSI